MYFSLENLMSAEADRFSYEFFSSDKLTWIVNFPFWIPDAHHSTALLDLFQNFDPIFSSAVTYPPLGISDHTFVSASIDFLFSS